LSKNTRGGGTPFHEKSEKFAPSNPRPVHLDTPRSPGLRCPHSYGLCFCFRFLDPVHRRLELVAATEIRVAIFALLELTTCHSN